MKRLISVFFVAVMCLFAVTALAEDNKCGDNLTYYYDSSTKTLTISGTGDMFDYYSSTAPTWNAPRASSGTYIDVVLEEGVTGIGKFSFKNIGINTITIPSTLKRIGESSLCATGNVKIIGNEKQVLYIQKDRRTSDSVMYNNYKFEEFFKAAIGSHIAYEESILNNAPIAPDNVEKRGYLEDNIYWTLDSDGVLTLSGNGELKDLPAPTHPYDYGICYNSKIKKVVVGEGITGIGTWSFVGNKNLTEIYLPNTLMKLRLHGALQGCDSLVRICYPGTRDVFYKYIEISEPNEGTDPNSAWFTADLVFSTEYTPDNATTVPEKKTDGITWKVENGVLTISGTGKTDAYEIFDPFTVNRAPWEKYKYSDEIVKIVFEDGIEGISIGAISGGFDSCKEIYIPDSVTYLSGYNYFPKDSTIYFGGTQEKWESLLDVFYHRNNDSQNITVVCNFKGEIGGNSKSDNSKDTIRLTIGQNTVYVFGEEKVMDVAPKIVNGRTMLPIRFVAEALGAEVEWNQKLQEVDIGDEDTTIFVTIGIDIANVNGKNVKIDAPPFIENGRTYLPVRFISESLGATVEWDNATQTVIITP